MFPIDTKAVIETLKSAGRFVWFTFVGAVSAFLVSLASSTDLLNATWTVPWLEITLPVGVYIVASVGFAYKALDRYLHESKFNDSNGIAPSFLQK